ncbi:heme b synthase [Desulfovibrio sp. JC022]|uniref:heme b synthase n=1 Tax=Desulfovibrio sp. JC022 TaxID=2593642 RepID=UPI0013D15006|nr:heme b synthase [Desulfovibrio sp. JC022]NDV24624.1 heme b synthase [Desulfovibrio sp. JC022]
MSDKKMTGGHPGGHPGGKPGHPGGGHPGGHPGVHPIPQKNADGSPPLRLIAWEITRSCNLACKHCRAEAHPEPYPGELSTEEAKALIDTFPETGDPIIIFTGGEPLLRHDVFELVSYANDKGLRCVMAPNGTLLTAENSVQLKEVGIQRCSISIDAKEAKYHDEFRGEKGAFDMSMQGIQYLKDAGIEFQINTTVTRNNLHMFKDIFHLAKDLGASAWHIFLLVPTGRASELGAEVISADEYEEVLNWFYDFQKTTDMQLKATCAPHYHRILRQRAKEEGIPVNFENFGLDAVSRGCLGGVGFCFISHRGQVQPCGYLDLDCGNVREIPFPEIWAKSPQFLNLRNPDTYDGKCGHCEYEKVCGGCRARAQTMEDNYLGPEPLCSYEPKKKSKKA